MPFLLVCLTGTVNKYDHTALSTHGLYKRLIFGPDLPMLMEWSALFNKPAHFLKAIDY